MILYRYNPPTYIREHPQSQKMSLQYARDIGSYNNALFRSNSPSYYRAVEMLRLGKIDYQPFTDAFILKYQERRTDYITSAHSGNNWLITPDFADFITSFRLPEHQIFDAVVEHRNKRFPYKLIYFYSETISAVDFNKSIFYYVTAEMPKRGTPYEVTAEMPKRGTPYEKVIYEKIIYERINIASEEEYAQQIMEEKRLRYSQLTFKDPLETDIIIIIHIDVGLLISEHLKTAIQAAGFTGMDFEPVPTPLVRGGGIPWADTGLPVKG